ncbi:hypothetical protein OAW23_05640 [Flavobacteriales bacterium]|nr:hypothetical protein [Flavobacteriales bacterium]
MKKRITFLLLLYASFAFSQEKRPYHVSGILAAGPSLGKLKNTGTDKFRLGQSYGLDLLAQIGYLWKEKIDLSVGAGIESFGQKFYHENFNYDMSYLGGYFRSDLQIIFPFERNKISNLSVGLGGGINNASYVELEHHEQDIDIYAHANKSLRYFIAPHIGFQQEIKGNHFTIAATFKRHIASVPLLEAVLFSTNAQAQYSFHGSYLGIYVKYDWHLNKKNKITNPKPLLAISPTILNRPTITKNHLKLSEQFIKIKVWDHSAIDGDTVSIRLNNDLILVRHLLKRKKKVIHLRIAEGEHLLTLMAHNQGTSGENTCAVIIKHGRRKDQFIFQTNQKRHESMKIEYRAD